MKERGQEIDDFSAKWAIRRNAENNPDWPFRDEAKFLYEVAPRIRDEVIDTVALVTRDQMPDPLIGFDDARNNKVLAYYLTVPNAHGIPDEIIMNTVHYEEKEGKMEWKYGRWSQLETLTHEMTHLYFNYLSKLEGRKIPAHGKEFTEKMESMGFHVVPVVGSHFQVAEEDSAFGRLMKDLGIDRPDDVPREKITKRDWFRPKPRKGRSTLTKYECPECHLKVRVGVKDDPRIVHDICTVVKGEKVFFVKHDQNTHVIYEGKGE